MKKAYETPSVEVVKFQYRDQVVATSGVSPASGTCTNTWTNIGKEYCEGESVFIKNHQD